MAIGACKQAYTQAHVKVAKKGSTITLLLK
jgi:hypothetical protein